MSGFARAQRNQQKIKETAKKDKKKIKQLEAELHHKEKALTMNSKRWRESAGNCDPVGPVKLNPGKLKAAM